MKKTFYLLFVLLLVSAATVSAQNFAKKGVWELGGAVGFSSTTGVFNGESADESRTNFYLMPYAGYFIMDNLELGLIPQFSSQSFGDLSSSSFAIIFAPAYHFTTGSNIFPFIEGRIGYNTNSFEYETTPVLFKSNGTAEVVEESSSGILWGARGGIKAQIGNSALVNVGISYTQRTLNPEDYDGGRIGDNVFMVEAGFTVFLGR